MKLLIFEFATAIGVEDPSITAEGYAMLNGLLDDLKDFQTYHLVPAGYEPIKNCLSQPVTFQGDIKDWLQRNVKNYDACLPIAPEGDKLLQELTLIIEEHGVEVLGSSSNAVGITTNKFDTYNALKHKVPVINTEKVYFNDLSNRNSEYIGHLRSLFKNNLPKVIKPADGVSCMGVWVVNSFKEFITAYDDLQKLTQLPYFLFQDFIYGTNVSVSLLSNGDSAIPLSLNFQDVHIDSGEVNYNGGRVPYKHELYEIGMETAKNAVESIDGLKGYVGVDMILDEGENKVHVVEINSRLTTPYVALRKIINFNLGVAIINSVYGELPAEIKLNGTAKFYKEDKILRIRVIK
jgi:tyramine---L-glutamate ligase